MDDPYEYENKFPPDMLPSPDWAQDDDDWNEAMKYRVYECDEEDGALLEGRSRAAVERGGGRDEGLRGQEHYRETSRQRYYHLRRHDFENGIARHRHR